MSVMHAGNRAPQVVSTAQGGARQRSERGAVASLLGTRGLSRLVFLTFYYEKLQTGGRAVSMVHRTPVHASLRLTRRHEARNPSSLPKPPIATFRGLISEAAAGITALGPHLRRRAPPKHRGVLSNSPGRCPTRESEH